MGQCISLIMVCYRDVEFIKQFLGKGNVPVSRDDVQSQGVSRRRSGYKKISLDNNGEFLCRFENTLKNSMCFATDGSKREGKTFTGFAVLDINYETMEKHRTSNIASILQQRG